MQIITEVDEKSTNRKHENQIINFSGLMHGHRECLRPKQLPVQRSGHEHG